MEDSFIDRLFGVIARPAPTFRAIARQRPVFLGLLVYLGVTVLTMAASFYGEESYRIIEDSLAELGLTVPAEYFLYGALFVALVSIFITTALLHLFARLFGGSGTYFGLLSSYAFANFPMIINVPILFIAGLTGVMGNVFSGLAGLFISLWVLVLQVLAVRESHGISTWAAIAVYVIHLVILFIVPMAIAVAVIIAFLSAI